MGSTQQDTKHFMFNSEESQGCRTFTRILPLALFPSVPSLLPRHSGQEGVGLLHFTIHSFSRAPRLSQQITMKDRSHTARSQQTTEEVPLQWWNQTAPRTVTH